MFARHDLPLHPGPACTPLSAEGCACVHATLDRSHARAAARAARQAVQLLPAQVDHGLRVRAGQADLQWAAARLLRWVLREGAADLAGAPPCATLRWRAIRQGARACLSLHGSGWPSALALPADDARRWLCALGASVHSAPEPGGFVLQVWLPLASNDPLHPAPDWGLPNAVN